jgi:hypothetical protein
MRILVISNCSNRKRISSVSPVCVRDLHAGKVRVVANQWVQALKRQPICTPLTDVYCGRSFSEALISAKMLEATFLVVSAGLGLVNARTSIPTYGATVTSASHDNVLTKLTDGNAASWWRVINEISPFAAPLETELFDLILIAVSRPYFALLQLTLENLSAIERKKVRLFLSMSDTELPTSLCEFLMPYGNRFDHSHSPIPGTKSDFTQRAMRHFATLIVASNAKDESAFQHAQRVESELKTLSTPIRPVRKKLPNSEIGVLIERHWDDCDGGSTRMLRYLRDVLGVACEQKRFQHLFNKIRTARLAEVHP